MFDSYPTLNGTWQHMKLVLQRLLFLLVPTADRALAA